MKVTTQILLATTALLAIPAISLAEPPAGDRPDRPSKEEMLAKFDKDADGKLSDQERVPMLKERIAKDPKFATKLKEKFDADKDGELSDAELLEAAKKMKKGKKGGKGKKADKADAGE